MFRHSLLPSACFGVVLGLTVVAPTGPARSQDRLTLERLDRVERDLNMLQRQVYRGAPAPMLGGDPGGAASGEVRMDRLEQQMRELTGRVEEFTNQIQQLRQRVEQINGDVDTRVGQTPSTSGSFAATTPPPRNRAGIGPGRQPLPEPPGTGPVALTPPALPPGGPGGSLLPPDAGAPPSGPSPIFNTLTPPGSPPQPDLASAAAGVPRPPTERMLPNGSAGEQYNYAFGLLKQADYPAAEAALKAFVEQHPKDPMAGNAQYWLGETYYTRGRFIEAASAFAEGYKRYPKGSKAPDELLKLGMSLARANQKDNACVALAQLDHDFPTAAATIKDRAGAEKKRLGC
jgi:tol-pal system protein YbgF